jgi:peptide/nickel transport system permease protein
VTESFFGIPGLGAYMMDAISGQDFAIVRAMVFLGSVLYILSNILIDVAYTWADPRVRMH